MIITQNGVTEARDYSDRSRPVTITIKRLLSILIKQVDFLFVFCSDDTKG